MSEWNARKPTEEEYLAIAKCLFDDYEERTILKQIMKPLTVQDVVDYIKDYFVTVIDGYTSDSQGYAGKVFTIVWGDVYFQTRLIEDKETGKLIVLRK